MFVLGPVVESLCRKARYWPCIVFGQLNKVNVVHFKKNRRGKIIRLQENKLLSDALLDETTSALKLKKI
jgi:hypothetical protein